MIIRRIKLKNFRNFSEYDQFFEPISFVKGLNGTGKTTLALKSILFCLWGYSDTPLSDLPTRNIAKSCTVEIELIHNQKGYRIVRSYPTKLQVFENNELMKFTNNKDAQDYINKTFGDRNNFQKFHIIDSNIGANFLEEGQVGLKKVLFSNSDELFNEIREKLNKVKYDREMYNKDKLMTSPHCPSEVRVEILEMGVQGLENKLQKTKSELAPIEQDYIGMTSKKAKTEGDNVYWRKRKKQIEENKSCYACKRGLSNDKQKEMIDEIEGKIENLEISMQILLPEIEKRKELLDTSRKQTEQITTKLYGLKTLISKLETRIKQKEYKYTNKDVLIVKKAIEELDRLSSYYISESLKILEPIINNIVSKIGFEVKFTINEKGRFAIELQKDTISYKYKDLSTGQKLVLQIAFKLALLLERNETGLIIADEGLSSLDENNLLHVISIFDNLPFQLFMVLHNAPELPESIKIIDLDSKNEEKEKINK